MVEIAIDSQYKTASSERVLRTRQAAIIIAAAWNTDANAHTSLRLPRPTIASADAQTLKQRSSHGRGPSVRRSGRTNVVGSRRSKRVKHSGHRSSGSMSMEYPHSLHRAPGGASCYGTLGLLSHGYDLLAECTSVQRMNNP